MAARVHTRPTVVSVLIAGLLALATVACGTRGQTEPANFQPSRFQAWVDQDPVYRLFPGDEMEVIVHTASELTTRVRIAPDGRANLPLVGGIMVTDLTPTEASRLVAQRYASVLRDPIVEVRATDFGTQRILVGGEVAEPGLIDLPGPRVGALEAVLLAGGFQTTARRNQVVILRRAPDGGVMMRTVDLRAALRGNSTDSIPLSRHDIVFVPRSNIAQVNLFVDQYVRGVLPLDTGFTYAVAEAIRNSN